MSAPPSPAASSSSPLKTLPTYLNTSQSRLQALYSDVSRQRHSNPSSYHSHVEWWRKTLETLVSRGLQTQPHLESSEEQESNKLILRAGRGLVEELRFPGVGKPLGLGAVIAELRNTKAIIPNTQFLQSTQSVYDPGWLPYRVASYILGKPLWWALEQLELVKSEESYNETEWWKKISGDYVVLGLVEKAADAVLRIRETQGGGGPADDLFSFDSFRKAFGTAVNASGALGEADTKVLVKFLERDRKVISVDKEVIKFINSGQAVEITAVDRGILELKTAVQSLEAQIDSIQRKIDSCTEKITSALRSKRKPIALSYLRSRKQLEDLLGKRLGSLEVLQSTLIRVEGAAGDVEIMKSYESSTVTLRMILDHPSLQRDKIDETMDAMASASADAREMDEAIRLGGDMAVADAGIDESELEDELQALAQESEKEMEVAEMERAQRLRENAPEAPRTPPRAQDAQSRSEEDRDLSIPIAS